MKTFATIYLAITAIFWLKVSWGQPWRVWRSTFLPALLWPFGLGMLLFGGIHIQ